MYVCICHAVTNRQIHASIEQGARTLRALRDELGVGSCCGKCMGDVRSQLQGQCGQGGACPCAQAVRHG